MSREVGKLFYFNLTSSSLIDLVQMMSPSPSAFIFLGALCDRIERPTWWRPHTLEPLLPQFGLGPWVSLSASLSLAHPVSAEKKCHQRFQSDINAESPAKNLSR